MIVLLLVFAAVGLYGIGASLVAVRTDGYGAVPTRPLLSPPGIRPRSAAASR